MGHITTECERGTDRPRLVAFMTCYTEGMSGGDAYFVGIAKRQQGVGLAIPETMTGGLPVYREIFPTGIVTVPQGDRRAFAEAILSLLADGELRRRVSTAGREVAERFDWRLLADRERRLWMGLALAPSNI